MMWELLNSHDWTASNTLRLQPDGTMVEVMARRVIDGPRVHFVLHFADLEQIGRPSIELAHQIGVVPDLAAKTRVLVPAVTVVNGPAGSGRATAAQTLRDEWATGNRCEQIDRRRRRGHWWAHVRELLSGGTDVLLRRAENIPAADAGQLAELVAAHQAESVTAERQ